MHFKNKILCFALIFIIFASGSFNVFAATSEIRLETTDAIERNGSNEDIWLAASGSALCMRPSKEGTWLRYEATVPAAGSYDVYVCLGKGQGQEETVGFIDESSGKSVYGIIEPTVTYGNFTEFYLGTMYIDAGKHTFKFDCSIKGYAIYFDYVRMTPAKGESTEPDYARKTGSYRNHYLPCVIEAEDYDMGSTGSYSTDGKNTGKRYRADDPIDIYENGAGSEKYYIELGVGEYTNYTFNVETEGVYSLSAICQNETSIEVYFDDLPYPVNVFFEKAGEETSVADIYLTKGQHKIKCNANSNIVRLDNLTFESNFNKTDYITSQNLSVPVIEDNMGKNEIYKELYVSQNGDDNNTGSIENPFKTLKRAKEEVASLRESMTGDIIVNINPGYYELTEEERFLVEHGGKDKYNVIYQGTDIFNETVISGGRKITGWKKTDNELYTAHFETDEEIRELYINDYPAVRAKSKYRYNFIEAFKEEGSQWQYDGIYVDKRNFPDNFMYPHDLEFIWEIIFPCHRILVNSITEEDGRYRVKMDQPSFGGRNLTHSVTGIVSTHSSFYIENDLTLLDEPGEFFYDKYTKTMYYYPREGENPLTDEIYAGVTQGLMRIEGNDLDNRIKNITFRNLSFKYSTWTDWYDTAGYVGESETMKFYKLNEDGLYEQDTDPYKYLIPSQINVNYAENVNFNSCVFACLGSSALAYRNAVVNSSIIGNVFKDLSGSGISVGISENQLPEDWGIVKNLVITNNVMRRIAYQYRTCSALVAYYANGLTISHNDLEDCAYSGISVGWGFGFDFVESANHRISYNRVVSTVIANTDGAHLYTLGPLRNTEIFRNYCTKTSDWRGGIYYDEGTGYVKSYENVVEGVKNWLWAREGAGLYKTSVYNNYHDTGTSQLDPQVTYYNNTIVKDGKWPEEAIKIKNEAGLEKPYSNLLKKAEIPQYIGETQLFKIKPTKTFQGKNDWSYLAGYSNYYHATNGTPPQNGENIASNYDGEYFEYDVRIDNTGMYTLWLCEGNNKGDAVQDIYIDGKFVKQITVPNFVENRWTVGEFEVATVFLEEGIHTLKIARVKNDVMMGKFKFDDGKGQHTGNDNTYDEGLLPSAIEKKEASKYFDDLTDSWAKSLINTAYEAGLVTGVSNTQFMPEKNVSLYEAATLASRAVGLDYSYEQITASLKKDDEIISREQFCDIVMKAYSYKKGNYSVKVDYDKFTDFNTIKAHYIPAVWGASDLGIVNGYPDGTFLPEKFLTRAEATVVALKLYYLLK